MGIWLAVLLLLMLTSFVARRGYQKVADYRSLSKAQRRSVYVPSTAGLVVAPFSAQFLYFALVQQYLLLSIGLGILTGVALGGFILGTWRTRKFEKTGAL